MEARATLALKPGVWFRRGRLLIVSPDSLGTACPLSGRNSTYRLVQILEAASKLAAHYKSNPDVIFGLMNEPHVQTAADWLGSANAAIAAIRSGEAQQEVLLPVTGWDEAWS